MTYGIILIQTFYHTSSLEWGQICYNRRYWLWALFWPNLKGQCSCHGSIGSMLGIFPKGLKLISDSSNRCHSCWAKKIVSPRLNNFRRGAGTNKSVVRAWNKHLFDQHQSHHSGCPTSIPEFPGSEFSSLDSESETLQLTSTIPRPRPSLIPSSKTRPSPRPRRVLDQETRYFESESLIPLYKRPHKMVKFQA